ncbi:hypothetical protein [Natronorubrum daqingense]|uniref:Uncharacterized protein n=1 Tax=Natronorubrum daqingense TaxID=588898 RepID=A0A1N7G543_9EURY|nr:hypothetical protein [Natronorubrum daqingense]APX98734.1 hypothetical protein BB347_18690 [Natronorubrum daqingense]SIS07546.1 hypothetical protein SAMN05421809_3720 [Natronorubrum daqingense]
MTRSGYNPDVGDRHEFPKIKAEHGEDPSRFLQSGKQLAKARIAGIRDPELLEAYRAVTKQILSGSSKTEVLEHLAARERELTGQPEPEEQPIPATDGGEIVTEPEPESEPDELHPETKGLEVGEVLVVDRNDSSEYVWPTTPNAPQPYVMRAFDAEDNESMETMLSIGEIQSRLGLETETVSNESLEKNAPRAAATRGEK